jgi:UDP-N-acetylmuramoylalanine--D-glutamate ligase
VRLLKTHESDIKKAIKNFSSLPHRLEPVGTYNGITFYDDAISTTPESTIMAIKSLPQIGTIFLGGEDRGYDFKQLEKELRKHKIPNVVLFPTTGKRILKSRKGFKILETKDMKEAVDFAFKNTPKGQICLLSTASPSYSVWKNFEEKGDLFQKFIRAHAQK